MCGVKANLETVGLDAGGRFDNCFSSLGSRVDSLVDWAHKAGKATGIVTNTRVSHATPAALYAHSASRYWEDDSKVPADARTACKDITRQLVEDSPGNNISVILGGGRRHWLPKGTKDPEQVTEEGRRLDGRNLIEDWLRDSKKRGLKSEYVQDKEGLQSVDRSSIDRLLGLFSYSHMEFEADRDPAPSGDPSLADMADVAVSILQRNSNGFFLFLESGRIDHAHHYNNAYRALDETLVLEAALLNILSLVDLTETLFVVTSDHSNVMTFGGLSTPRGNPILGADTKVSDVDGLPYSTLLYGTGPGYARPRVVPSNQTSVTEERNVVHASAVARQWATHGGEDVPVYAQGPLASVVFKGVVEQSYIPHAIAYVLCLGEYSKRCKTLNQTSTKQPQACITPDLTAGQGRGGKVLASSQGMLSDSSSLGPSLWSALILATHVYLPLT
ncbi:alkaline phosphatase, tissue-nonspecific isozyme-like isoform X2 [Homalodisca vitripennis]|nr:alkaline phosphatase, tissue-nonspecific isozyme-like isoform X2 [Homalodisca vitripennis]XP_046684312.1 alkaline phosphatase, tissue-nonspecific isozyme-like isoform X2 [Homalodisca vitripennis]